MMQQILIDKLRSYIVQNNPELMLRLQQDFGFKTYLEDKVLLAVPQMEQLIAEGKPAYIIEELCMQELTGDLRPSRFNYIKNLLEVEFLQTYERFREMGVITYEVVNLIEVCNPVFDHLGFSEEDEDNSQLRYAVIGSMDEYLNKA